MLIFSPPGIVFMYTWMLESMVYTPDDDQFTKDRWLAV